MRLPISIARPVPIFALSLGLGFLGAAKLWFPAPLFVFGSTWPVPASKVTGAVEILLAGALWAPKTFRVALYSTAALLTVAAINLAFWHDRPCGCAGSLRFAAPTRAWVTGVLLALVAVLTIRSTRNHTHWPRIDWRRIALAYSSLAAIIIAMLTLVPRDTRVDTRRLPGNDIAAVHSSEQGSSAFHETRAHIHPGRLDERVEVPDRRHDVEPKTLGVRVTDTSGAPIARVQLVAQPGSVTLTDASGSADLAATTARFDALHPSHVPVRRRVSDEDYARGAVTVVMESGNAVEGRVTNTSGTGVSGARVWIGRPGAVHSPLRSTDPLAVRVDGELADHDLVFSKEAMTDSAGNYRIGGIPEGDYELRCEKHGWLSLFDGPRGEGSARRLVVRDQSLERADITLLRVLVGAVIVQNETNLDDSVFRDSIDCALSASEAMPAVATRLPDWNSTILLQLEKRFGERETPIVSLYLEPNRNEASTMPVLRFIVRMLGEEVSSGETPLMYLEPWSPDTCLRVPVRRELVLGSAEIRAPFPVRLCMVRGKRSIATIQPGAADDGRVDASLHLPVGDYAVMPPRISLLDTRKRTERFKVDPGRTTIVDLSTQDPVARLSIAVLDALGRPAESYRLNILGPSTVFMVTDGKALTYPVEIGTEYRLQLLDTLFERIATKKITTVAGENAITIGHDR